MHGIFCVTGERVALQAKRVAANLLVAALLAAFFYGLIFLFVQSPVLLYQNCQTGASAGEPKRMDRIEWT